MKSPSAPPPPDPVATASAQSGANRDTAVTQGILNMTNQVTPDGSLTYNKIGDETLIDSLTGKPYTVPRYQATQTLSESGQALKNISDQTERNIATIGRDQSARIGDLLSRPLSFDGIAPAMGANSVRTGTYQDAGDAATNVYKGNYQGAGNIADEVYKGQYKDTGTIDYSADRQKVEDALMARLNPQLDKDRSALETKLANQGIMIGSQAWNDAIDSSSRASNDARLGAILNAGTEQSRLFGMTKDALAISNANEAQRVAESQDQYKRRMEGISLNNQNEQLKVGESQSQFDRIMAALGLNNANEQQRVAESQGAFDRSLQLRNQGISEATAVRNQPINEISALLSGSQVGQPNFVNTPTTQVAGTDYQGAVQANYAAQMQAYQQKVSQQNAMMGGLFGLAGTIGKAFVPTPSDRRLKRDIERVGMLPNGLPTYTFRYLDHDAVYLGLMSDDVRKVRPEAVMTMPNGFDAVDYDRAVL